MSDSSTNTGEAKDRRWRLRGALLWGLTAVVAAALLACIAGPVRGAAQVPASSAARADGQSSPHSAAPPALSRPHGDLGVRVIGRAIIEAARGARSVL
jgi:hypothetical protein